MKHTLSTTDQLNLQEADAIYGHTPQEYRRFLRNFAITVLLVLMAAASLNFVVDPYARYETIRAPGFNERKPAAVDQVALTKTHQIKRAHPQTLLLGNSRVDIGLDPQSGSLPPAFRPAYNLAIPGTGVEAALFYLRHASVHGNLKQLILGVDFMDFLTTSPGTALTAGPRLDGNGQVAVHARLQQSVRDTVATLLSLSATVDTMNTLLSQSDPNAGGITPEGLNLASQFNQLVANEGHHALFTAKNLEYLHRLKHGPRRIFVDETGSSASWQALQQIVEHCATHNIQLKVFIHPYHADILELFSQTGLWAEFELWKRTLSDALGSPVALWDFSGHSEITGELLPAPGDSSAKMQWYWEGGHYKRELGERIIARLFGANDVHFGMRITPVNIEQHLQTLRERKAQYAADHSQAIDRIRKLSE